MTSNHTRGRLPILVVAGLVLMVSSCNKQHPGGVAAKKSGAMQATEGARTPSQAAEGSVHALDGSSFELAQAWAKQPVVIVFYRGHW